MLGAVLRNLVLAMDLLDLFQGAPLQPDRLCDSNYPQCASHFRHQLDIDNSLPLVSPVKALPQQLPSDLQYLNLN